jgi:hypothetical protein
MSQRAPRHQGEAKTINRRGRGALERPGHGEVLAAVLWMVAGKNGGVRATCKDEAMLRVRAIGLGHFSGDQFCW